MLLHKNLSSKQTIQTVKKQTGESFLKHHHHPNSHVCNTIITQVEHQAIFELPFPTPVLPLPLGVNVDLTACNFPLPLVLLAEENGCEASSG